jgi:hypothetical protein
MSKVYGQRYSSDLDQDIVVFLIGMRLNQLWRFWKWLPVFVAMPSMIIELRRKPTLGLLSAPRTFISGRVVLLVQYWESFEKLENYARASDAHHLPAWRRFNKRSRGNHAVGIWHETYKVPVGNAESIYVNMPIFGLAAASNHVLTSQKGQSAARRLGVEGSDSMPVPANDDVSA